MKGTVLICTSSSMHPYNCSGEAGGCLHCLATLAFHDRKPFPKHNAKKCALCSCVRCNKPVHRREYKCLKCGLFFCPSMRTKTGGHVHRWKDVPRCNGKLKLLREPA